MKINFTVRNVQSSDMSQLLELENEWPENARASQHELKIRIDKFQEGFFVAEDNSGIMASIICHPYRYQPENLSDYTNWKKIVSKCYQTPDPQLETNALYIVSGTTKPNHYGNDLFDAGINHIVALANKLGKQFVIGGCLLPGLARYVQKHGISPIDYVFKKSQGRAIDPLIEKYRRLGFLVPDESHVISDYFPHGPSLNYSALVVCNLREITYL